MNFFGAAIYVREPGVEEVQPWYLDLVLNNDRIQDTVQAACCVEVLMKHIHTRWPDVRTCHMQSDNAPTLANLLLLLYQECFAGSTGVRVTQVSHNEPHCGKDVVDGALPVVQPAVCKRSCLTNVCASLLVFVSSLWSADSQADTHAQRGRHVDRITA